MAQSVTELLARLRYAVESEVGEQSVIGEIGSCKIAGSGHVYFTLKDARAQLQCVLYRYQAALCRIQLREGMSVELTGKATVWEGRGTLQFTVTGVREAGTGSLQQQFEALKRRLAEEGLFDSARKRQLPRFPQSVGLITSATGAVIQDMRHRLEQRAPWIRAYLLPVAVQGKGAESGIARALTCWNEPERYHLPPVDYIIVARGGGSLEDLWCFNEEVVARAIAASRVPVVSAVGHETDFTIADFTADLRAPTPTAAIELTTPDREQLDDWLRQVDRRLRLGVRRALENARLRLRPAEMSRLRSPHEVLAPFAQRLDVAEEEIQRRCAARFERLRSRLELYAAGISVRTLRSGIAAARQRLTAAESRMRALFSAALTTRAAHLEKLEAELRAASPQNALDRGFALVRTADGHLARRAAELPPGTPLSIRLAEGELNARVE